MSPLPMHVLEWIWLALLMVGPPLAGLRTRRVLLQRAPSRRLAHLSTIVNLAVLGLATFTIDYLGSRVGTRALRVPPPAALAGWTAGTLFVSCAISIAFVAWRIAMHRPMSRVSRLLLPERASDWPLFALVSLVAGTTEEFMCRGFEMGLLASILHGTWPAAVVVAVFFGLGHVVQDWQGALRAAVLGFVLAVPVIATGSLLPAMIAHAATNLLTPLWMRGALAISEPTAPAAP